VVASFNYRMEAPNQTATNTNQVAVNMQPVITQPRQEMAAANEKFAQVTCPSPCRFWTIPR